MKILVDTNILMSAVWRSESHIAKVLKYLSQASKYELYLTDQNIAEFRTGVARKMPDKLQYVDILLSRLDYKVIPAVIDGEHTMRDLKDQPILNAAIIEGLDVVLTGDKDFLVLDLDRPKCLTVAEFCEYEGLRDI